MSFLHRRAPRFAAILLLAATLVLIDAFSGPFYQTPLLYVFPIGLAAWFFGRGWGFAFAVATACARGALAWDLWQPTEPVRFIIFNVALRLFVFLLIAELVHRYARLHALERRRLDLILEHMPVGVGVADAQGRIIGANPAAKAIWGGIRTVDREGYRQYRGRYPGSESWFEAEEWALAKTMRTGEPVLKEVIDIETFDGARKTILNSTVRMNDEKGRPMGAVFVNQDITDESRRDREREDLIRKLEEAMANVRTLKGLLPICASCKKIRDDEGYWNQIEDYVREHADVRFSHGICPECAARIYPEYVGRTTPAEDD
jgi:PAS domain S-box-containing protein